jgi:hypothetical protein
MNASCRVALMAAFCALASSVVMCDRATAASAATAQELAVIRSQLRERQGELSMNRKLQKRADTSPDQLQKLGSRESDLVADIDDLKKRERALNPPQR